MVVALAIDCWMMQSTPTDPHHLTAVAPPWSVRGGHHPPCLLALSQVRSSLKTRLEAEEARCLADLEPSLLW
jgi:hypothetical protein